MLDPQELIRPIVEVLQVECEKPEHENRRSGSDEPEGHSTIFGSVTISGEKVSCERNDRQDHSPQSFEHLIPDLRYLITASSDVEYPRSRSALNSNRPGPTCLTASAIAVSKPMPPIVGPVIKMCLSFISALGAVKSPWLKAQPRTRSRLEGMSRTVSCLLA